MICQAVPNRLLRPSIGDAWASDDATERRLTRIRNVISWLKHKRFALDCFAYVLCADREGRQGGRRTRRMTERYQSPKRQDLSGAFCMARNERPSSASAATVEVRTLDRHVVGFRARADVDLRYTEGTPCVYLKCSNTPCHLPHLSDDAYVSLRLRHRALGRECCRPSAGSAK